MLDRSAEGYKSTVIVEPSPSFVYGVKPYLIIRLFTPGGSATSKINLKSPVGLHPIENAPPTA